VGKQELTSFQVHSIPCSRSTNTISSESLSCYIKRKGLQNIKVLSETSTLDHVPAWRLTPQNDASQPTIGTSRWHVTARHEPVPPLSPRP
jgi:hypothetical protein